MTDAPQSAGLVALADRIELWPIDRLRPYERNPRTHSEAQVDQIAASMVEFGWTNPVLVDEQGGVLAGHGRLLAARKLGLAEVPVIRFEHLSEAQKRAYLIADNQLALQAGWSEDCWPRSWPGCGTSASTSTWSASMPPELERLLAIADGEPASEEAEDEVPEGRGRDDLGDRHRRGQEHRKEGGSLFGGGQKGVEYRYFANPRSRSARGRPAGSCGSGPATS